MKSPVVSFWSSKSLSCSAGNRVARYRFMFSQLEKVDLSIWNRITSIKTVKHAHMVLFSALQIAGLGHPIIE